MGFRSDLSFGQYYEKVAIELEGGNKEGKALEKAPDNKAFSDWDFRIDGIAFETKADRQTYRTGNLCIEYEHSKKPSGISISKADIWYYFSVKPDGSYTCYRIPIGVIKEKIKGARQWNTDGGNSKFYLVPSSHFSDYIHKSVELKAIN